MTRVEGRETNELRRWVGLLDGWTIALSAIVCGSVLIAVGQPVFTDDFWWHLAHGAAYLQQGPWLAEDPLLFTATEPPSPAAWLADALLYRLWESYGFAGARVAHALLALWILGLAWIALRRTGASRATAMLGTTVFAILAAYRLVQLRPELFSLVGVLGLYLLVLEGQAPGSWRRIVLTLAWMMAWANLHPAFPLGIAFLGIAFVAAACGALARWAVSGSDASGSGRAKRLGGAFAAGMLGSAINPTGLTGHLAALHVGTSPEALAFVVDEWSGSQLLTWPATTLPPTPLSWILVWILILGSFAAGAFMIGRTHRKRRHGSFAATLASLDPVPFALAAAGIAALAMANRFLWLGIFPILLVVHVFGREESSAARGWRSSALLALASTMLVATFYSHGAWPMITRGLPASLEGYRQPYPAQKYHAGAAWLMADAGLSGNLFAPYSASGFMGFWLAPEIQTMVNGSLNVPSGTMEDFLLVRAGLGREPDGDLGTLLDELDIDLFLGAGTPSESRPGRPPSHTTLLLEDLPGWLLVFRNVDTSLYLRHDERNASNLRSIQAFYAGLGVPFDLENGFDPIRVATEARRWAVRHRLVPPHLFPVVADPARTPIPLEVLADRSISLLLLGAHEAALRLNEAVLARRPGDLPAHRRRIWLLLQSDRADREGRLRSSARILASGAPSDALSIRLVQAASAVASGAALAPGTLARLPVLTREEAYRILSRTPAPPARTTRGSSPPVSTASRSSRKS